MAAVVAVPVLWLPARILVENLCPLWFWSAELSGRVTDEHGQPVAGVRVVAEYFGDRSVDMLPGSRFPALSDAKGEFVLSVVPGAMTLFARKDGFGFSQPLDLEPEDGQELAGIELALDPGGRITGECIGADGKAHSGRWIAIEEAGYGHWWAEDRIANLRTGESGEFTCERVPSGEIRVMLGSFVPNGLSGRFQGEQVVTVRRGETTRVHFEPTAPANDGSRHPRSKR